MDVRVRERAVILRVAPDICNELMRPTSRLSYRMMHGLGVAAIGALEHANRVVARERRMLRWG